MEKQFHGFLCVFIIIFTRIHLVQAQDQKGFISLDCGVLPEESPLIDISTGLTFTSDFTYIKSGKNGRIQKDLIEQFGKLYVTLRYFPEGERNCYNLNVTQGTNYLIRASFLYGNYDGVNNFPKFDLFIGPNKWITVDLGTTRGIMVREIIHVSKLSSLQICLVKTGATTPMISTLELRPLRNDTYISENGSSLHHLLRAYLSNSGRVLRYPDDVYDRSWLSFLKKEWTPINTTLIVNISNSYDPPKFAMSSAATHENDNETWNIFSWKLKDATQYQTYLHFAEIQTLLANETREFNVLLNDKVLYGPYSPKNLSIETITITKSQMTCDEGTCVLQLARTRKSTLPPLINAIEIYSIVEFPHAETNRDDVVAIKNLQEFYGLSRISWQGDPCVPKKFSWAGLICNNADISIPPTITSLNLSSSGLNGIIAPAIQNLTHLQELDLSYNNLTGAVPEFLADMKPLLIINLSGNNLSGQLPQKLLQKKGLKLKVEGNPNLNCKEGPCVNKNGEGGHPKKSIIVPIVASVASMAVLIAALILFFVLMRRKKSSKDKEIHSISRSSEPPRIMKKKIFTYGEVTEMTNNFERILGKGGFGIVYHGYVNGTEPVAVKVLSKASIHGYKQFKAEVELLLRVHHKNLVGLVGYCEEGEEFALVYEYMAKGDLKELLTGKHDSFVLSWGTRLKIAVEAAQGLEYLHKGCRPSIVHRDVKTANILLDEHFQAKLADFGLSRSFPIEGESHLSTDVAGTHGYLDPEYYRTNWLTEKSDVYSFGVVLLEIITNRRVIDQSRERPHIAEWVGLMVTKGDIRGITDPSLQGDYHSDSVWKAIELAMSCLNPTAAGRPTMSQVLIELNECLTSENSRGGASRDKDGSIEITMAIGTKVNPMAR